MAWLKKILTVVLLGLVALALFFLIAGKDKTWGKRFLYQEPGKTQYLPGDLFNFCEVNQFKEKISGLTLRESTSTAGADIILEGDSFCNTGFDSEPLPNYLETVTGQTVFYRSTAKKELRPLEYLEANGYQKGEAKYFIWETIERYSVNRGLKLPSDFTKASKLAAASTSTPSLWAKVKSRLLSPVLTRWPKLKTILFDRVDVEYFIKNNFLFKPINLWFNNQAFNWLGDIDSRTPVYLNNPRLLFYFEEVEFAANKSKFDSLNKMADGIALEAKQIKQRYNLTLVYLVIPNKFSIYGDLVPGGQKYDNFIPKLEEALGKRGVKYVDIYQVFKAYQSQHPADSLYYAGDTHYAPRGKELVIQELLKADIGLKQK